MEPIRVLLVDDHTVLRAGLRMLLDAEPDVTVVGEAGTGEEGVELAARLRPDVVVMDLSMPGEGGLEATRRIAAAGSGTRVLVLTPTSRRLVHARSHWLHAPIEPQLPNVATHRPGRVTRCHPGSLGISHASRPRHASPAIVPSARLNAI